MMCAGRSKLPLRVGEIINLPPEIIDNIEERIDNRKGCWIICKNGTMQVAAAIIICYTFHKAKNGAYSSA